MSFEHNLVEQANQIVETVIANDTTYGTSWRKRGGVGAFMMMARKWDRIENLCRRYDWDLIRMLADNRGNVRDDLQDLVGYALLSLEFDARRERAGDSGVAGEDTGIVFCTCCHQESAHDPDGKCTFSTCACERFAEDLQL